MSSYYRIQQADRDVTDLLDATTWESRQWFGETYIACFDCDGSDCATCDGTGEVEDVRNGISACDSIDDLVYYFQQVGGDLDNTVIVEMDASRAHDEDHDAHLGAVLVHPTSIVSVTPVTDDLINRIYA